VAELTLSIQLIDKKLPKSKTASEVFLFKASLRAALLRRSNLGDDQWNCFVALRGSQ
jgi:hypothetical protein